MTSLPILLPDGFQIKVKSGEKVSAGQVLAESEKSLAVSVSLGPNLGIKKNKVKKYLKKYPGDSVSAGEVIAEVKGVFGKKTVTSKISGIVSKFDEEAGEFYILASSSQSQTIHSPVDGVVEEVDDRKITVKTERESILGINSSGDIAEGEVISAGEKLDYQEINSKIRGKILLAGGVDRDTLAKAIGMGAIGVIVRDVPDSVLETFSERKIPTPVIKIKGEDISKFESGQKVILDASKKLIVKL
ncbi:MAG: hypothetical protein A2186_04185 [Candidatus Levybacteria bacterium RIFOXYA1_FULL_41_10]|nr:MAG: hypothetical protein UT87_C0007G0011 [Candidatus Levybacteria bacterium GW2011_GWC1_40_19]KKR94660.1 MAG: hypothetical protein UU45_C0008G0060 [Candidatus Levybacteria bacterium GW2011_GWA2_41_15]KKS00399.1 MAG: hypothetical protein UU52_C0034G0004 [Candidatus Levybacteria bacterium GW2011_GWB1_41_21]OGH26969.1 MAG: hypothetical protein A3D82_02620 [Candidatus Levybacteria bacterium RIFCSPHIGHO2_02_FULL_40_29]OGH32284.1 MAG: hypothetical protein A3E70_03370 [Candidatus Levybacteria bact